MKPLLFLLLAVPAFAQFTVYPQSSGSGGTYCNATGGATNTYICTGSPSPSSYTSGMVVSLRVDAGNTAAATLNISNLGAKNIYQGGSALASGTLAAGSGAGNLYTVSYDGTQFNLGSGVTGATGPAATQAFAPVSNAGTDVICALHTDTITGLTCNNAGGSDAITTPQAFATTTPIPAGTLTTNVTVPVNLSFGYIGSSSAATVVISIKLGSVVIFTSSTMQVNSANTATGMACNISATAVASTTTPITTTCSEASLSANQRNTLLSTTAKSVAVDTTISETISVTVVFSANTAGNALYLYSISPGSGGAVGATGATGATSPNTEGSSSTVMTGPADCAVSKTYTGSSALSYTLLATPPSANCQFSIQNNTTQTFTINGVSNSATVNGSVQNYTLAGSGNVRVVVSANGTSGWDVGAGPVGATGPTGAAGTGLVSSAQSNITPVTVAANVTSDQVLQQISLPAGFFNLQLAQPYTIKSAGIFTIGVAQVPALTYKVNLCTVSGCGSGTVRTLASFVTAATVAATNNPWSLFMTASTTATGASGTLITHGLASVDIGALTSTPAVIQNDTNTAASSTIDLTAALFLQFTVATSAGSALNSFTQQSSSAEPGSTTGATGAAGAAGATGATGAAGSTARAFPYLFTNAGAALTASTTAIGAFTSPIACTINFWDIDIKGNDTATIKTYKIATGTAHPTSANSGVSISSNGHVHSTTVSDFTTTTVAQYDIIAFALTAVGGTATEVTFTLGCN